jgi:hypothetical protein
VQIISHELLEFFAFSEERNVIIISIQQYFRALDITISKVNQKRMNTFSSLLEKSWTW